MRFQCFIPRGACRPNVVFVFKFISLIFRAGCAYTPDLCEATCNCTVGALTGYGPSPVAIFFDCNDDNGIRGIPCDLVSSFLNAPGDILALFVINVML